MFYSRHYYKYGLYGVCYFIYYVIHVMVYLYLFGECFLLYVRYVNLY
jgi:hypothetical protein